MDLTNYIFNLQSHIFKTILDSWMSSIPKFYDLLDDIVGSTLKVFTVICNEMLPTPNKSHYTFNLRDLSKVFQGILMADAKKILVSIIFLLCEWKLHKNKSNNKINPIFNRSGSRCLIFICKFAYTFFRSVNYVVCQT